MGTDIFFFFFFTPWTGSLSPFFSRHASKPPSSNVPDLIYLNKFDFPLFLFFPSPRDGGSPLVSPPRRSFPFLRAASGWGDCSFILGFRPPSCHLAGDFFSLFFPPFSSFLDLKSLRRAMILFFGSRSITCLFSSWLSSFLESADFSRWTDVFLRRPDRSASRCCRSGAFFSSISFFRMLGQEFLSRQML